VSPGLVAVLVVGVLGAVIAVLCWLLLLAQARMEGGFEREREQWFAERRELLDRVQAPERLPLSRTASWSYPQDSELDEIAQVGQIDYTPEEQ
jgi:hypothetical protein